MSKKSWKQTNKRLEDYPMDWKPICQSCRSRFYTKLKMEHNPRLDELYFYRERFCSCSPRNDEILIVKRMDENGTEYPARTITDDITETITE